jgi:diadenosine tetraphosphate (Ap4A) HIT family hydrolase
MPTLFTRIINKELPGKFVYTDEVAVAFLSINPITPGHTLIVPRLEVDEWTDAPDDVLAHLTAVARKVGNAVKTAFDAPRAGLIVAGLEVPHLHIHVMPVWSLGDFDFAKAKPATDEELDDAAAKLRAALGGGSAGGA